MRLIRSTRLVDGLAVIIALSVLICIGHISAQELEEIDKAGNADVVTPASLTAETEDHVIFRMEAKVLFDFDKDAVRDDAAEALYQVAGRIRQDYPDRLVMIAGHTYDKGSDKYNKDLSDRRAAAVKSWLVETGGLAKENIQPKGLGENHPVAENKNPDGSDSPEGRQKNRRVEIVVFKTRKGGDPSVTLRYPEAEISKASLKPVIPKPEWTAARFPEVDFPDIRIPKTEIPTGSIPKTEIPEPKGLKP